VPRCSPQSGTPYTNQGKELSTNQRETSCKWPIYYGGMINVLNRSFFALSEYQNWILSPKWMWRVRHHYETHSKQAPLVPAHLSSLRGRAKPNFLCTSQYCHWWTSVSDGSFNRVRHWEFLVGLRSATAGRPGRKKFLERLIAILTQHEEMIYRVSINTLS
jgi:hypothetical protein